MINETIYMYLLDDIPFDECDILDGQGDYLFWPTVLAYWLDHLSFKNDAASVLLYLRSVYNKIKCGKYLCEKYNLYTQVLAILKLHSKHQQYHDYSPLAIGDQCISRVLLPLPEVLPGDTITGDWLIHWERLANKPIFSTKHKIRILCHYRWAFCMLYHYAHKQRCVALINLMYKHASNTKYSYFEVDITSIRRWVNDPRVIRGITDLRHYRQWRDYCTKTFC